MAVLGSKKIRERLETTDVAKRIVVTPVLDPKQIGSCTIDLRLGTNFKVDMVTRQPYIDPMIPQRPIATFFDETYREFGDKFILYPDQLVLGSTFEYLKLPQDLFGLLHTRSSWNRLGLSISTVIQPGYSGVLTLELKNTSSNPVALYPGLRFVQLSLLEVDEAIGSYTAQAISKYVADVEPKYSNITADPDIEILRNFKHTK